MDFLFRILSLGGSRIIRRTSRCFTVRRFPKTLDATILTSTKKLLLFLLAPKERAAVSCSVTEKGKYPPRNGMLLTSYNPFCGRSVGCCRNLKGRYVYLYVCNFVSSWLLEMLYSCGTKKRYQDEDFVFS